MQKTEEDSYVQMAQMCLQSLYRFTCNYQGYTFINFLVLGLNMALLWVINYSVHQHQTLQCRSVERVRRQLQDMPWRFQNGSTPCRPSCSPQRAVHPCQNKCANSKTHVVYEPKFPKVTKRQGPKSGPLKARRKSISRSPKKCPAVSEDDAETLDEITWSNDSASPVFSPKAVRHSAGFLMSPAAKFPCVLLKPNIESLHRQNKPAAEIVPFKFDPRVVGENLDKLGVSCRHMSPRNSVSTRERQATTKGSLPRMKHVSIPDADCTDAKRWSPVHVKLKLPAKMESPIRKCRKQAKEVLVLKPYASKCATRGEDKKTPELNSYSVLKRSPRSRCRMKKFTKKRSIPSSGANVEKLQTKSMSFSDSYRDSPNLSSEAERMSDQQSMANPSDSSIVFQRDSWIWFSPETRPNAENFTSRQMKFRSQDPRVAALAEEIRRQDQLNRDIEKTAESLVDSSSHSTGKGTCGGTRCRPSWQRGKYGVNNGKICRQSKTAHCSNINKSKYPNKCATGSNKCTLATSNSCPSSVRTLPFCHAQNRTVGAQRVAVQNADNSPGKNIGKVRGGKISVGGKAQKTSGTRASRKEGDKTQEVKQSLETDDTKTHDIEVLSLRQNEQISDNPTGLISMPSNKLLGSAQLRPGFRQYPKKWTPYEGDHGIGMSGVISQPTNYSNVNALNACASGINAQYVLPCPGFGQISSPQNPAQLKSGSRRDSCELWNTQKSCSTSNNIASMPIEQLKQTSVFTPNYRPVSKAPVYCQLEWDSARGETADAIQADSYPNPEDVAGIIASTLPVSSLEAQPAWLKNYCSQLVAESNLRAPENRQGCMTAGGGNSLAALSGPESHADKPVLGKACLEDIITAEVNAAIHKLLLESATCGTAPGLPTCALKNSPAAPGYDAGKSNNGETTKLLVADNAVAEINIDCPDTKMIAAHSQGDMSKCFNESPDSIRSECADTYLLDLTQSRRADNANPCSNVSCLETKTKNQKRINIYTKAYYLGKRAAQKKKNPGHPKTCPQTQADASVSQWKKPYITWSKTVSLHLYSPTNKLSPRSQLQQKKYEQYMRKLKPCLKVRHGVAEQSPNCISLSEESRFLGNGAQSVASDSTLIPTPDLEKDAFTQGNCQKPMTPVLHSNTKEQSAPKTADTRQLNKLSSTNASKRINNNLTYNHISTFKNPARSDISTRTLYRKPKNFGSEAAGVSNSFPTTSSCRKTGPSGQGLCRPVATFSNNNSSSSVIPYQSPTAVIYARTDPPPTYVSQMFFVTHTNVCPEQVCSQNNECRLSKCHHHEDPGSLRVYGKPRKRCCLKKVDVPTVHCENSSQSVRHNIRDSLITPVNNVFVADRKLCDKRGSAERLLLRTHSFRGKAEVATAFPKHRVGIYEHAIDKYHPDIWAATATNNINFDNPQILKSYLADQAQNPLEANTAHGLLIPPMNAMSLETSSDGDLPGEPITEDNGVSRFEPAIARLSTTDANKYKYCNHQTTVVPSMITNVSNPDSGFDEPLSDTGCTDHTAQHFLGDLVEDSTNSAQCESLVDNSALTDPWHRSASPCSDVSNNSEPGHVTTGCTKSCECLSEQDIDNIEFDGIRDTEYDTFDAEYDTFDTEYDTFDTEYDTFDTEYDTFDLECDILGDSDGIFNARSS